MSSLDFSRFIIQNQSNCQNLEDLLEIDPPGDPLNLTCKIDPNNNSSTLINDQLHLSSGNLNHSGAAQDTLLTHHQRSSILRNKEKCSQSFTQHHHQIHPNSIRFNRHTQLQLQAHHHFRSAKKRKKEGTGCAQGGEAINNSKILLPSYINQNSIFGTGMGAGGMMMQETPRNAKQQMQ